MEKIISITENSFSTGKYSSFDGYIVTTSKQTIKIGISNGQSCCEQWGYICSNDDFNDFIGANLLEVKVVDDDLNVYENVKEYSGMVMFVNLETNRGTLQFVLYNDHNGYYSHAAVIVSDDWNTTEYL